MSIPINMALVQSYDEDLKLKFSTVVTTFSGVATQLHLSFLCGERYTAVAAHGNIKRGKIEVEKGGTDGK